MHALLVRWSRSAWPAQKTDQATSTETEARKHTKAGAVRSVKRLVPEEHYAPLRQAGGKVRQLWEKYCLPYDHGLRVLSQMAFLEFQKGVTPLVDEVRTADAAFVEWYADWYGGDGPREWMGDLYDPSDYPHPELLREKFKVRLSIRPLPDGNSLPPALQQYAEDVQAEVEDCMKDAQRELWQRLLKVVEHFVECMRDEDAIFRDGTVEGLQEFAALVPKLAVVDDPELVAVCQKLAALASPHPQVLRLDKKKRAETAQEAIDAVNRIKEAMDNA